MGELSTPRWTAAIHERRWNHQPMPATVPENYTLDSAGNENAARSVDRLDEEAEDGDDAQSWRGDLIGGYQDENHVSPV